MHVIGTAGHVDHGKSTLIAALTGIHPDRLKEEKEREMTIDLGFAWLTLPGGEEVGIVDVPGHRDFIENMLAGVGGIDAVLLVIAADEGVMPQTREHLAILDLLQIKSGIVVLTKIDVVDDPEWLELTETEIRKILQGTFLQDAPILRVSSRTKAGFPELLKQLGQLLQNIAPRLDLGRPRLPIDRIFSIAGFGTVVTGTLTDGNFRVGEEVEILPSGVKARIRGLQTHKKNEPTAVPGSRTAINLANVDMGQVWRGEVVARPGHYSSTQRLDVHFRLLPDVSSSLHHHSAVKLFLGASDTVANVRLLGAEILDPGETGWLQLELQQPVLAVRGDRYILRRPSPGETLGGGVIVDPFPKERHKRFDEAVVKRLSALMNGTPTEVFLQASLALGLAAAKDVVIRSRLEAREAQKTLEELLSSGQLVSLEDQPVGADGSGVVVAQPQWLVLKESIAMILGVYHETYPLRRGIPREELKSRLKLPLNIFNLVVHKLALQGELVEGPKWAALPDHHVRFSPFQQVKVERLMEMFAAAPFAPPTIKECKAEVGEDILNTLLEFGDLVAVSGEVVFRKTDYDLMQEKILKVLHEKGRITLAEARDLFNTSRRYTQALLEHLDATGMTVREGDFRKLKG